MRSHDEVVARTAAPGSSCSSSRPHKSLTAEVICMAGQQRRRPLPHRHTLRQSIGDRAHSLAPVCGGRWQRGRGWREGQQAGGLSACAQPSASHRRPGPTCLHLLLRHNGGGAQIGGQARQLILPRAQPHHQAAAALAQRAVERRERLAQGCRGKGNGMACLSAAAHRHPATAASMHETGDTNGGRSGSPSAPPGGNTRCA